MVNLAQMLQLVLNFGHRMETDPHLQLKFHGFFTAFWGLAMIVIVFVRVLWGNYPALVIEEVSLWANAATHFGAMSAAIAAIRSDPDEAQG